MAGKYDSETPNSDPFAMTPLWHQVNDSFRAGSTLIQPHRHQLEAVCSVVTALEADAQKLRPINYLLQHATGSGKSLTVAAMVKQLLEINFSKDTTGFQLVLLLNDRLQLDSQLSEVVESFLISNGVDEKEIAKAYNTNMLKSVLTRLDRLQAGEESKTLPRVVFSTLQKFSSAQFQDQSYVNILTHGRISIIADEAHRSHGKSITGRINQIFGGNPTCQPLGLVYISLTATPSNQVLRMFGMPQRISNRVVYAPFHTYPMSQAVKDGVVLNVLQDYTTVRTLIEWQSSVKKKISSGQMGFVMTAVASHVQVLKYKAKFILKHYLNALTFLKQMSSNDGTKWTHPKAMLVCRSRAHVHLFCKLLQKMIKQKQEAIFKLDLFSKAEEYQMWNTRPAVYGAFSGELDGDSEISFNGSLRLKQADILVVCNKLETGYNEPRLGIMYVDRLLRGAKAVQVLSRLNRKYEGKQSTCVVDFVNSADQIREAYSEFWGQTVWAGRGEHTKDGNEAEIELQLNMKMDSVVSKILGSVDGLKDMTPKQAAEALISSMDNSMQDSLALDLEVYIEACSRLSVQKIELPFAWASHLHQQLQTQRQINGQSITADEIQNFVNNLNVDVKGVETTHSGEIIILKCNQVLPTQPLLETQKKSSADLTLAKMVENSYLLNGGTQHIKSLMRAIMNPDLTNSNDSSLILNILRRLDLVEMTLHYLQETKVASIVRSLKTHQNAAIAELAKNLVKRWKRLVSVTSPIFVLGVGDGSPAEADTREKIILKLIDSLQLAFEEFKEQKNEHSSKDMTELSKLIEKDMFTLCNGANQDYRTKFRSLLFNLKDAKNKMLRNKVISGEISTEDLVKLSSEELANQEVASLRNEVRKRKLEELEKWTSSKDSLGNSSEYTCSNCKSDKCYVNGTGTRGGWVSSQMEPSIIVTCCNCNFRWEAGAFYA